jgi:hypothetical protein
VPFISDADLRAALDKAGLAPDTIAEIMDVNSQARVDGLRAALVVLALLTPAGVILARRIPTRLQKSTSD